jgi:hypothetical protein
MSIRSGSLKITDMYCCKTQTKASERDLQETRLRTLNWVTILVHTANAIAALAVQTNGGRFHLTHRLLHRRDKGRFDRFEVKDANITLDLQWLIFIFFALSAGFQIFSLFCKPYKYFERFELPKSPEYGRVATVQKGKQIRNKDARNSHPAHWMRFVEYTMSASVMLVAIALLNGVDDVRELACIFMLCAATQMFGLLAEREQSGIDSSQKWIAHLAGWVTFVTAYGVVMSHYLVDKRGVENIPWYVEVIVWSMLVLFSVFGLVQLVRTASPFGILSPFHAEVAYLILSVVAKTLLGWLVLGVALRPT